ncbi:hypothetical protein [Clostridium sp.]|uniref:hypothetical protein n=1 Tax=Clostridium sp. TaxID=1506 RepID=UPI00260C5474|nr:hypothetical protein [Clostridium sp.]
MPNRAERRKIDKNVRKKLTPQQFKDFTSEITEEYVKQEIDRMSAKLIEDVADILPKVLKQNRVSDQRVDKILSDFSKAFREKYKEVFEDEGLSKQRAKESNCNNDGSCTAN